MIQIAPSPAVRSLNSERLDRLDAFQKKTLAPTHTKKLADEDSEDNRTQYLYSCSQTVGSTCVSPVESDYQHRICQKHYAHNDEDRTRYKAIFDAT